MQGYSTARDRPKRSSGAHIHIPGGGVTYEFF
jgi:hypothetical protein